MHLEDSRDELSTEEVPSHLCISSPAHSCNIPPGVETVGCTGVFAVATPKAENISAPNVGIINYFMVKM